MAKLWQRSTRKTGGPFELEEVVLSGVFISSPTILFLPGVFTTNKKKHHVAEGMAELESLLARHNISPLPAMYGLSHNDLGNIFNVVAYNGCPDKYFSPSARAVAEAVIMPLVTKGGKPLAQDKAAANLRNLTLVGYSAGTVFAQEMFNASLKLMKQAGYADKAARALLREVVLVSMATVSRPSREKGRFTTLYLAASNDIAVRVKNSIWRPLSRIFSRHTHDLTIQRLSQESVLVTAGMGENLWDWQRQADGTRKQAQIEPLLPPKAGLHSNHEMPHYLTCDDAHNPFSKLVLHALANALGRSGMVDAMKLLEPIETHAPLEADNFQRRLKSGITRGENRHKRKKEGKNDKNRKGLHPAPAHPRTGGPARA